MSIAPATRPRFIPMRVTVALAGAVAVSMATEPLTLLLGVSGLSIHVAVFGLLAGAFAVWIDRHARAQRRSEQWFEMGSDLFCELRLGETPLGFARVNPACAAILGWTAEEMTSRPIVDFVHPDDVERAQVEIDHISANPSTTVDVLLRFCTREGGVRWLLWNAHFDRGTFFCVGRDITDRKLLEETTERLLARVDALARTDELTGLPNRRAWNEEGVRERARALRQPPGQFSVVMIDLDGLKSVNDAHGHQAGDEVLRAASDAWLVELRDTDFLARIGGDEFGVLLADCSAAAAQEVAARLAGPLTGGHTASVGLATFDGREQMAELVHRADQALYRSKRERDHRTSLAGLGGP